MDEIKAGPAFKQPTPASVSARIRHYRKSRSLTLHDIERLSLGRIKAVVMGSYERGTRAISLARTIEIANLFEVPVTELIAETVGQPTESRIAAIFDLRKVGALALESQDANIQILNRYLKAIAVRRSDWNGEVLSLRAGDFDSLTLLLGKAGNELLSLWRDQKILLTAPNHL